MASFIPIEVANPNIFGNFQAGAQIGRQRKQDRQATERESQLQALLGQAFPQQGQAPNQANQQALSDLQTQFPARALAITRAKREAFDSADQAEQSRIKSVAIGARELQGKSPERQLQMLKVRREQLRQTGKPTNDTDEAIGWLESGQVDLANQEINGMVDMGRELGLLSGDGLTAGQQEFESLTEGLTEGQVDEARLIKLGLSPRAVGSAIQTIAANDLAEVVGDAEAVVAERKKFGDAIGASRAKTIDSGFDRIQKIDSGVRNIDRAISALEGGADTGAVQRFLPAIRSASVELANIQKSMALDVIGAVTFGALSKGELDLAKEVALPDGLNEPQLIKHLQDRRAAQLKLRDYFSDQINFLDQGGTVAGFIREQERGQDSASPQQIGRFTVEAE